MGKSDRLLLLSFDELLILWDALMLHRRGMSSSHEDFPDTQRLAERVGDLMEGE